MSHQLSHDTSERSEAYSSPWAAPAVLVKKKNRDWRFCHLLVHPDKFEAALGNLWEVFVSIRGAGLRLNLAKYSLLNKETKFLGHVEWPSTQPRWQL